MKNDNTNKDLRDTYKDLNNHPEYLGAYLNMACHNVFLIINHLTEKFKYLGFSPLSEDEHIKSDTHILAVIFDTTKKEYDLERQKVYNYLLKRHHLPYIRIFNHEQTQLPDNADTIPVDFVKLHASIHQMLNELVEFRNDYTHYLIIDDSGQQIDRKRTVHPVIKQDMETLFKYAPEFSWTRHLQRQEEKDYNHLEGYQLFSEDNTLTDHGIYFFVNLFLERKYALKFLKRFKGFKNEQLPEFRATLQAFTTYALKIPDERLGNENKKESLLMEILNELVKCPAELFNHIPKSDQEKFVPVLEESKIKNILENSTTDSETDDSQIEDMLIGLISQKRHEDRFPYFALRYLEDMDSFRHIRFQITLGKLIIRKYEKTILGENMTRKIVKTVNAFGKLSDFDNKHEEVLQAIRKMLPDAHDTIVFEQYAPHYNMNNNKIAFYVFDTPDQDKIKYPQLHGEKHTGASVDNDPSGFISIHDLPKIVLADILTNRNSEEKILSFLKKTNQQMLDKQWLDEVKSRLDYPSQPLVRRIYRPEAKQKSKAISISEEYSRSIKDRRAMLDSVLATATYKIQSNQLPALVLDYLMEIRDPDPSKLIHNNIIEMRDECKKRKKAITKELLKAKEKQKIKLGELATYLATDFIRMIIDEKVKERITSIYYNLLQNKLAYLGDSTKKEELIALCKELGILDKNKGHVFLTESLIRNAKGIVDLYITYLDEKNGIRVGANIIKAGWFDKLAKTSQLNGKKKTDYVLDNKNVTIPYLFTKLRKSKETKEIDQWLARKIEDPVNIPNSLFDDMLIRKLRVMLKESSIPYSDTDKLSILLTKYLNGDTQPFYEYDRIYNVPKKKTTPNKKDQDKKTEYKEVRLTKIHQMDSKSIVDEADEKVAKMEKQIRFTQTKDRILKLMCLSMVQQDRNIRLESDFKLRDTYPASITSPLEAATRFQQKIFKNEGKTIDICTIIAEDTEQQKKEVAHFKTLAAGAEQEAYPGQKNYEWKVKDYGRFRRFIKDRRIYNLSKYFIDKDIPFSMVEYQLNEYDKYREKIFSLIFQLEKTLTLKYLEHIKQIKKSSLPKYHQVTFQVYLDALQELDIPHQSDLLKGIRNKFAHSEFPSVDSIPKITSKQIATFLENKDTKDEVQQSDISIAQKIYNLYNTEIQQILDHINQ